VAQTKTAEVVEDAKALEKRFYETLKTANSHKAKPAQVQAFKDALASCVRARALPPHLKSPLEAARDFALDKAGEMAGPAMPELWQTQARQLADELGHETAPPLERMMIDNAVLCWARLAVMELRYSAMTGADNTFRAVEHIEKRLTAAQKRFTRACEALARVRKLKLPAVQINVAAEGGQQVNVA
jgi:hypothetical protein